MKNTDNKWTGKMVSEAAGKLSNAADQNNLYCRNEPGYFTEISLICFSYQDKFLSTVETLISRDMSFDRNIKSWRIRGTKKPV